MEIKLLYQSTNKFVQFEIDVVFIQTGHVRDGHNRHLIDEIRAIFGKNYHRNRKSINSMEIDGRIVWLIGL